MSIAEGYVANLKGIGRLIPEEFDLTTKDMLRWFCWHLVDVENECYEKDGVWEDIVEEMIIEEGVEESWRIIFSMKGPKRGRDEKRGEDQLSEKRGRF